MKGAARKTPEQPLNLWALSRHPKVSIGDVQYVAGINGHAHNRLAQIAAGVLSARSLSTAEQNAIGAALLAFDRAEALGARYRRAVEDPFGAMPADDLHVFSVMPPRRSRRCVRYAEVVAQRATRRGVAGRSCYARFREADWNQWKRSKRMPLTSEVLARFGLDADPFDEPRCEEQVYRSGDFERRAAQLRQGVRDSAFMYVIGPSGSGKSQLVRCALRDMARQDDRLAVCRLLSPVVRSHSERSIVMAMLEDFGRLTPTPPRNSHTLERSVRRLRTALHWLSERRWRCVLLLEEAHEIPAAVKRSLKRLRESVEDGFEERLSVIVIGQDDPSAASGGGRPLHLDLHDPDLREVGRRVMPIRLKPLGRAMRHYVHFRIQQAGGDAGAILDESAYDAITRALKPEDRVPQAIDTLVAGAMQRAFELDDPRITGDHIDDAASGDDGRRRAQPAA